MIDSNTFRQWHDTIAKGELGLSMRVFGRSLQLLGLILLPLSMVMELTGGLGRSFGVSDMVLMLAFGSAAFLFGRLVEGYARAS